MDTLQERLKKARKAKGLSQGDLAELAGITQPTYSDLERGISKSSTRLAELARALDVNLLWLSTGEGEMRGQGARLELVPSKQSTDNDLSDSEKTLLKAYRELCCTNKRQASLVMQVAFGANPAQSNTPLPTMKELFESWKEAVIEGFGPEYAEYLAAANDKNKAVIKANIGGRVIQMFEERKTKETPPDGVKKRKNDPK